MYINISRRVYNNSFFFFFFFFTLFTLNRITTFLHREPSNDHSNRTLRDGSLNLSTKCDQTKLLSLSLIYVILQKLKRVYTLRSPLKAGGADDYINSLQ